jgi:hypothetical protein
MKKPDKKGELAPRIPCARCGKFLPYDEAVKTVLGEGWAGYTHAEPCEREKEVRA